MIAGKSYIGQKADIWSCGVILYALVCGFLPFEDQNTSNLYKKILAGEFIIPDFLSKDVKDLIAKILVTDPEKRLTIEQIRDHSWFSLSTPIQMSEGIIIGYNQIPIEGKILEMMKEYGFESEYTQQCLDANKHNHATTTYYLFLKRLKLEGKLQCEYEISNIKQKELNLSNRKEMSVRSRIEYENSLEKQFKKT